MGFVEVQFPDGVSYGSSGGPGFRTDVIEVDSGAEQRVARWDGARRRYNAAEQVKSYDDLSAIVDFYIARKGPEFGFRYKDWSDYTTAANHRDAHTAFDHLLGTGDGVTTQFQLLKRYTSGGTIRVRNITKPVAGTVKVAKDAAEQFAGFSVNTTNGIVTFSVAPAIGVQVFGGCEHDVPVRFGIEIDQLLAINMDNFGSGSIPDIPLVEIIDGLVTSDDYPYRGARKVDPMTADELITEVQGVVQVFNPNAAGRKVTLPNPSPSQDYPGGQWFWIVNKSTANTLSVRNEAGTEIAIIPVAPGAGQCSIVQALLVGSTWEAG